ncbi:hypothetical protein BB560_000086, partial [Smittium megazygosporum]
MCDHSIGNKPINCHKKHDCSKGPVLKKSGYFDIHVNKVVKTAGYPIDLEEYSNKDDSKLCSEISETNKKKTCRFKSRETEHDKMIPSWEINHTTKKSKKKEYLCYFVLQGLARFSFDISFSNEENGVKIPKPSDNCAHPTALENSSVKETYKAANKATFTNTVISTIVTITPEEVQSFKCQNIKESKVCIPEFEEVYVIKIGELPKTCTGHSVENISKLTSSHRSDFTNTDLGFASYTRNNYKTITNKDKNFGKVNRIYLTVTPRTTHCPYKIGKTSRESYSNRKGNDFVGTEKPITIKLNQSSTKETIARPTISPINIIQADDFATFSKPIPISLDNRASLNSIKMHTKTSTYSKLQGIGKPSCKKNQSNDILEEILAAKLQGTLLFKWEMPCSRYDCEEGFVQIFECQNDLPKESDDNNNQLNKNPTPTDKQRTISIKDIPVDPCLKEVSCNSETYWSYSALTRSLNLISEKDQKSENIESFSKIKAPTSTQNNNSRKQKTSKSTCTNNENKTLKCETNSRYSKTLTGTSKYTGSITVVQETLSINNLSFSFAITENFIPKTVTESAKSYTYRSTNAKNKSNLILFTETRVFNSKNTLTGSTIKKGIFGTEKLATSEYLGKITEIQTTDSYLKIKSKSTTPSQRTQLDQTTDFQLSSTIHTATSYSTTGAQPSSNTHTTSTDSNSISQESSTTHTASTDSTTGVQPISTTHTTSMDPTTGTQPSSNTHTTSTDSTTGTQPSSTTHTTSTDSNSISQESSTTHTASTDPTSISQESSPTHTASTDSTSISQESSTTHTTSMDSTSISQESSTTHTTSTDPITGTQPSSTTHTTSTDSNSISQESSTTHTTSTDSNSISQESSTTHTASTDSTTG